MRSTAPFEGQSGSRLAQEIEGFYVRKIAAVR